MSWKPCHYLFRGSPATVSKSLYTTVSFGPAPRGDRALLLDRAGRAGGSGQRTSRARSRTAGAKGEPPELAGDAGWRCLDGENPMENPRIDG